MTPYRFPGLWAGALAFALLTVVALAPSTQAGGLLLYEAGTQDVALAGAGWSARAQDAGTVLTNPAGMLNLEGTQVLLGLQALYGNISFTVKPGTSPGLGTQGGNPVGWFPGGGLYVSHTVSPQVSVGLGIAGNFGMAEEYENTWAGRYYVQKTSLVGISFLPAIAYRLSETMSAGAALNAVYGGLDYRVGVNTITGPDGALELDDTTWGYGVNLGLTFDPGTGTRVGLTYTSQVVLGFAAPARFSGLPGPLTAVLAARGLLDAEVGLGMRIPNTVMLSGLHPVSQDLILLGSVGWQQWSRFGHVDVSVDSSDPVGLTTEGNFKDTWHGSLGLQHLVSGALRVDLGVGYDSAFQPDGTVSPALPANQTWRFGLGLKTRPKPGFGWGVGLEYAFGGTLDVNKESSNPVALGGRGDLVGAFEAGGIFFISGNLEWRF